jgi:hypothetical protein
MVGQVLSSSCSIRLDPRPSLMNWKFSAVGPADGKRLDQPDA